MSIFLVRSATPVLPLGQVAMQCDSICGHAQLRVRHTVSVAIRSLVLQDGLLKSLALPLNARLHLLAQFLIDAEVLNLQSTASLFLRVDQITGEHRMLGAPTIELVVRMRDTLVQFPGSSDIVTGYAGCAVGHLR